MPNELSFQRVPPQSLEAEQAVLGSILLENQTLIKALEVISDRHFYREAHRKIFAAILDLFERNEPIDLLTLAERLRKKNQLDEMGGISYLSDLLDRLPSAGNIRYHANLVKDKATLRSLISAATEIIAEGYEDTSDVDELLDRAERVIFEISSTKTRSTYVNISRVLKESFSTIERLFERKEAVTGVPTGFTKVDELTSGLQSSDLIIIAGRPGTGKTSLALNIAHHAAATCRIPVALFSLEMSKEQLIIRMLCSEAKINSIKLKTGYLSKSELKRLPEAAGVLSEAPIFIDDTPLLSVLEIRSKARRLQAEHNLGLIIIDYLQLIEARENKENRQQEISEVTRSLKALAKELGVPIVTLSQLSRAVEQRPNRRPQLSDLRESGAIEQDGDLIAFIYRDELYKQDSQDKGTAEILISKQRNGPTGMVKLKFFSEYTRFENLSDRA